MKFVPARCPSCGGELQIPEENDFVKCKYCGIDIKVREIIYTTRDYSTDAKLWVVEATNLFESASVYECPPFIEEIDFETVSYFLSQRHERKSAEVILNKTIELCDKALLVEPNYYPATILKIESILYLAYKIYGHRIFINFEDDSDFSSYFVANNFKLNYLSYGAKIFSHSSFTELGIISNRTIRIQKLIHDILELCFKTPVNYEYSTNRLTQFLLDIVTLRDDVMYVKFPNHEDIVVVESKSSWSSQAANRCFIHYYLGGVAGDIMLLSNIYKLTKNEKLRNEINRLQNVALKGAFVYYKTTFSNKIINLPVPENIATIFRTMQFENLNKKHT